VIVCGGERKHVRRRKWRGQLAGSGVMVSTVDQLEWKESSAIEFYIEFCKVPRNEFVMDPL
jgi:hypothetical protein